MVETWSISLERTLVNSSLPPSLPPLARSQILPLNLPGGGGDEIIPSNLRQIHRSLMELQLSSLFLPHLPLIPLTLLILIISPFSQSNSTFESKYDCSPLESFRHVLNESNSENPNISTWRNESNCIHWRGFTRELSTLNLSGFNLMGTINSLSTNLNLSRIDLSRNNFSGNIPTKLYESHQLTSLRLSHNAFDGTLAQAVSSLSHLEILDVSFNNLSGGIPSSLGSCKQLKTLFLQFNHFNGSIPRSLENLKNLKRLDLSNNSLSGQVPSRGIFKGSGFIYQGNAGLCGGVEGLKLPSCSNGSRKILVIAIVVPTLSLLLLSCALYIFRTRRSKVKNRSLLNARLSVRYTYGDLHEATKGFSSTNLIGSGSIGSVYKGFLENGKKAVAIKVFKEETFGDPGRFVEESGDLMKIGSNNLVGIMATCVDVDRVGWPFLALVYELMPNGNLEMWLHKKVVSQALNFRKWNLSLYQRLNVAIDVASALAQLHLPSERAVLHGNLKPSNVLFSDDMTASLTDFGMHRIFETNDIVAKSNGYISPECAMGCDPSPSWDVYNFGILLLEIFTRKKPAKEYSKQGMDLHRYVQQRFPLDLEGIVDPLLLSEETGGKLTERSRQCINSIMKIALTCSNENTIDRMEIVNALEKLKEVKLSYLDIASGGSPPDSYNGPSGSASAMLS